MSTKQKLLILGIYLLTVSFFAFVLTVLDKRNAKKGRRRISERTLFAAAILGGSLCEYLTMRAFRHKTLHKRFMLGLPAIMLLQATAAVCIYYFFYFQPVQ